MKKSIYLFLAIALGIFGCSSQKKIQTHPPFHVDKATCHKWKINKERSDSGWVVKILISELKHDKISIHELYFRGQQTAVSTEITNGSGYLTATFITDKPHASSMVMHTDPKMEFDNQPPPLALNTNSTFANPFELAPDEAVLSYSEKDSKKIKYTRIVTIEEKELLIYTSKQPN